MTRKLLNEIPFFCTILVLLVLWVAPAQVTAQKGKYRKAGLYTEALRYFDAIKIYQRLHRKDTTALVPIIGIANAYQHIDSLSLAAEWYAKALVLDDVRPESWYDYGHVLFQLGQCKEAQTAFNEFLRRKPYDDRANQLDDVCRYYNEITLGDGRLRLSIPDFNGPLSDLAPAFFRDGLVYGSVRSSKRRSAFYDLYFTLPAAEEQASGIQLSYTESVSFSQTVNSQVNEAIVAFSPDFREIYFTRNQAELVSEKLPIRRLEIVVSRQNSDSTWSEPTPLSFNSLDYSSAHPALSPDGNRLYFASDRPGGFGGKDLYYCDRIGIKWSSPINLGPRVNTSGDELYPHYRTGGELFFASDGHLGLGGLDIFRAEDLGGGQWSTPNNLGRPINSTADDFSYVQAPQAGYGFFTSNRPGGQGSDDIYAFQDNKLVVALAFVDEEGEPIDEAVAFGIVGQEYAQFSNEMGRWSVGIKRDECLSLRLPADAFEADRRDICASTVDAQQDTLHLNWAVKIRRTPAINVAKESPSVVEEEAVAEKEPVNVGVAGINGLLIDELDEAPVANATVILIDANGEETSLYTDAQGRFSYPSSLGSCFTIKSSAEGYFNLSWPEEVCVGVEPEQLVRLVLRPFRLQREEQLQAQQVREEVDFQVGGQTYEDAAEAIPYLLNIYYDLGRASVRAEAIPELNRLYLLLADNPQIVLEVGSHTDARGGDEFNQRLSQRRANAIVKYLVNKGIESERLVAKGYGETRLVNECEDGQECTEEEHQMNRRTEFRVLSDRLGTR